MAVQMTVKDSAVLFFVIGMLTGMIVAFASCSVDHSDGYPPARTQSSTPR